MSDLDDLAAAAGGGTRGGQPSAGPINSNSAGKPGKPRNPRAATPPVYHESIVYEQPAPGGGVSPMMWVGLAAGMLVVLSVAFWLVNRDSEPTAAPGAAAQAGRSADGRASSARGGPAAAATDPAADTLPAAAPAGAADPAGRAPAAKPASRPAPLALKDVEEPGDAIEMAPVKRDGDEVTITARNVSRRGVYVQALEFFAESDDRIPLASISFWLPAGAPLLTSYPIPELSTRLGAEEGVTAVIQEAEFSDVMPKELEQRAAEEDHPNEPEQSGSGQGNDEKRDEEQ